MNQVKLYQLYHYVRDTHCPMKCHQTFEKRLAENLEYVEVNFSLSYRYPASKVLLLIAFYMVFVWSPARKLKISGHGERGKGIQHSSFFGHFCYKLMSSDKKDRKNLGKKFALILLWL